MMTAEPNILTDPGVADNPNAEVIKGLFTMAIWLQTHPQMPLATAAVTFDSEDREEMIRLAGLFDRDFKALEEIPSEKATVLEAEVNDRVVVRARALRAALSNHYVRPTPPRVVLDECPHCLGNRRVPDLDLPGAWLSCEWCGNRGYLVPQPFPVSHEDFVGPVAGVLQTEWSDPLDAPAEAA